MIKVYNYLIKWSKLLLWSFYLWINKGLSVHCLSHKRNINMPGQTSFLHFLKTLLLHSIFMISHKLWHCFPTLSICLFVGSCIFYLHIHKLWLLFCWLYCWCCSPVLICLIISCGSNEARIIKFSIEVLVFSRGLRFYFKRFIFCLDCWCKISLYLIWNF